MRNLVSVKVKANSNYTCQECGSTEKVQAHHEIPSNDDSLIPLCAKCHSKRHPNVPKALFFANKNQPYWPNISAATIAKRIGCHSRTIIRRAKTLNIPLGIELSNSNRNLLLNTLLQPKLLTKDSRDIKDLRKCARMTLQKMAAYLGVAKSTVHRWEKGESKPSQLAQDQLQSMNKKIKTQSLHPQPL